MFKKLSNQLGRLLMHHKHTLIAWTPQRLRYSTSHSSSHQSIQASKTDSTSISFDEVAFHKQLDSALASTDPALALACWQQLHTTHEAKTTESCLDVVMYILEKSNKTDLCVQILDEANKRLSTNPDFLLQKYTWILRRICDRSNNEAQPIDMDNAFRLIKQLEDSGLQDRAEQSEELFEVLSRVFMYFPGRMQ